MEPKMKTKLVLIVSVILVILIIGVVYLFARTGKIKPFALALAPEIALNPSSGTYTVGQTFEVNISIDTAGKAIDGVDIHYLNYNPKALEVQDADANANGVQIRQGTLFPSYMGNAVDTTNGRISISGIVSPGGAGFSGSGTMATVVFKVLTVDPQAALTLDFAAGLTTDCNMVEHGTSNDVLSSVVNASLNLQSPLPAPQVDIRANRKNGPITVNNGRTVTLSWTSTDAVSCTASGGWSGDKATSGSEVTAPLSSQQNYILTCSNAQGSASDNVTVNIRTKGK